MKKVITALANPNVNEKLKKYEEIEIVSTDIQYKEGIIELLETNNQIDFIILSELLEGKMDLKVLIEKIKIINSSIKIIIILEKENKELENILISKGNIYIFYNNEVEINEVAKLIINKVDTQKLQNEINKLKELITNNETKNEIEEERKTDEILSNKEVINIQKQIEREYKEEKERYKINIFNNDTQERQAKIVVVLGLDGIGKSTFTANLAQALKHNRKQTLIIDLDNNNNSIRTLFGIKRKYSEPKTNKTYNKAQNLKTEALLIKINKKTDLLCIKELISTQENNINLLQLTEIIDKQKEKYDVIIIDTKEQKEYENTLLNKTDKIIFLSEANVLQIKKTKRILKEYIADKKIDKQKINLIFNKNKQDSIDFYILKEIFKGYNILGKINYIKNYNTLINENMKSIYLEKQIKKQYLKISKSLLRNNSLKQYYLSKVKD